MLERLPQRFLTPKVARAITSPGGILAAAAVTSVGIIAGAPIAAAAVLGGAVYAGRVALAVPRQKAGDKVDPSAVREPWRGYVQDAQQAQARFDRTVRNCAEGPLRERLTEIGRRISEGVQECWRIARQGDTLHEALGRMDVRSIEHELAQVDRERYERQDDPRAMEALDRTRAAVQSQLDSANRIRGIADDASNRLRVLNAQLDEAVARSIELSLHTGDLSALNPLTADVDNLVHEMESLRQALEETSSAQAAPGT